MMKAMTFRPLVTIEGQNKMPIDLMDLNCLRKEAESTSWSKCGRHTGKRDSQDSSPEQICGNRQTHSDFC